MVRVAALLALSLLLALPLAAPLTAEAARLSGIVILVDMAHGQNPGGLDTIMKLVPEAYWIVLVASPGDEAALPETVVKMADEIRYGGFTPDTLAGVDVVLIGQPTLLPDPVEVDALASWFSEEAIRVLWVAADSDYPAQGSETSQQFANTILEALGSKLRMDYVSVEDDESYAGRTYRVIGIVDPMPEGEASMLAYYASTALFHGPGAVYALDENGNPVNPIYTPVEGVYVIVRTSEAGRVVEHQTTEGGGISGVFYQAGSTQEGVGIGMFPLLAVETVSMEPLKRIIVSSETPYSGYQAMVTWEYKGIPMDGASLFKYLIYFSIGYMAPFKQAMALEEVEGKAQEAMEMAEEAASAAQQARQAADQASQAIAGLEDSVNSLQQSLQDLQQRLQSVEQRTGDLESRVADLEQRPAPSNTPLAVAVLALIIALGAAGLAVTRK